MPNGAVSDKQRLGRLGEDAALAFLLRQGLTLVERNVSCKGGEIDLIMRSGQMLVFVEVRQRASARFGGAAASITPAKQQRMLRAAQFYLLRLKSLPPCRIDVVAIDAGLISWLPDALQM